MRPYLRLWAKTSDSESGPRFHPLPYHLLDVAAVAERLIEREAFPAAFATARGVPPDALARFTRLLVALHDIGKSSAHFQLCDPDQSAHLAALDFGVAQDWRPTRPSFFRHGAITATYLTPGPGAQIAEALAALAPGVLADRRGGEGRLARFLIDPVAGHHGRPVEAARIAGADAVANAPFQAAARDLARDLIDLFGVEPLPDKFIRRDGEGATFSWFLSALIPVADWVGSNQTWFPPHAPDLDLATYWSEVARPGAARAIAEAGLTRLAASRPEAARILSAFPDPTPLQDHLATCPLPDGPSLFVIEDATGSGKTEAALTLAHRLMAAGRAQGFYFALPTTATADAMFARLAPSYRSLFEKTPDTEPSLSRVHGRAGHSEARQADAQETVEAWCADWLRDDRRKALLAQASAGTIDQALMAMLPLRYQSLRLFGLSGKVLIIDEVHSFDPYVLRLMEATLETHAMLGGSAILMSATLPRSTRKRLVEAYRRGRGVDEASPIDSRDYPLLTIANAERVDEVGLTLARTSRRSVGVARLGDVAQGEAHAIAAARAGCAVALIRSTVDAAIESYFKIAEALGPDRVELLHSRFLPDDRLAIERAILARFGKSSTAEGRAGRVVVATQVIQQSLDLDFDALITDLAPMDLLIQRAGRLWRHTRDARPLAAAVLHVISPDPSPDAQADWLDAEMKEAGWVYRDPALLWLTARALFGAGEILTTTLNAHASPSCCDRTHVRRLVEAAFEASHEELPTQGLREAYEKAFGERLGLIQLGDFAALTPNKGYGGKNSAFASEDRAATRLETHPRVRLRLAREDAGSLRPFTGDDWRSNEISVTQKCAQGLPIISAAAQPVTPAWPAADADTRALILTPEIHGPSCASDASVRYDRRIGLYRTPAWEPL